MWLDDNMKERVKNWVNRDTDNNYMDIKYVKVTEEDNDDYVTMSIWYRITFLGCKPVYKKSEIIVPRDVFIDHS